MHNDVDIDAIDRCILRALQQDGRMTFDQLAEQVQLSPSAALRRVRKLEESGAIAGYVAVLEPARVGLGLTAYLNVRIARQPDSQRRDPMESFRVAVQTWPEVVECASLSIRSGHGSGSHDRIFRFVPQFDSNEAALQYALAQSQGLIGGSNC